MKDQEIALVDRSYWWTGHGTISGLIGLAYSTLTSAYIGTNGALDHQTSTGTAPRDRIHYSPIVTSMIMQGLNPPLFSLSLTRPTSNSSSPGGYLAFGGLPPVSVGPAAFTSTPIIPWQYSRHSLATNMTFYGILPEAYIYNGIDGLTTDHTTELHTIIDSGIYGLYVSVSMCLVFEIPLTTAGAHGRRNGILCFI